jgi:Peptidyl-tRNA hydrolase PTH2
MNEFKLRRCRECGEGTIRAIAKPGRMTPFRNVTISVPDTLAIPTCDHCGNEFIDASTAEALDALGQWCELRGAVPVVTLSACRIDQHGPTAESLTHHVIVRKDLPWGVQLAQVTHAAGESAAAAALHGVVAAPGTTAVVLHVENEAALMALADRLRQAGHRVHEVRESDDDHHYASQLMAIAVEPIEDRAAMRRLTSSLPLARERRPESER